MCLIRIDWHVGHLHRPRRVLRIVLCHVGFIESVVDRMHDLGLVVVPSAARPTRILLRDRRHVCRYNNDANPIHVCHVIITRPTSRYRHLGVEYTWHAIVPVAIDLHRLTLDRHGAVRRAGVVLDVGTSQRVRHTVALLLSIDETVLVSGSFRLLLRDGIAS